jgi:hypothetical protein
MANPVGPSGNWTLVFEDDFPGTTLNTANWTAVNGAVNSGVTTKSSSVSVSGGYCQLILAAMINSNSVNGFPGPSTGPEFVVGNCIEAMVSFPGPSGDEAYNWPAFWASGADWPANGEEDIFESYNGTPSALNYHTSEGANNGPFPSGSWCNSFHTYTCVRGPGTIDVYWDGVLERSVTLVDDGGPQSILFLIGSANTVSDTAVTLVEYVRMWTPGGSGPTGITSTGSISLQPLKTSGNASATTAGNITQDASTPAVVTASGSAGSSLTTASFSPPANALLVVMTSFDYQAANTTSPVFTISDSASGTYTAGPSVFDGSRGIAAIWTRYLFTAPGAMTVSISNSGPSATHGQILAVYVLNNAGSVQTEAASDTADSATAVTAWTMGITTTVSGSWVLAAAAGAALGTITPQSTTTGLETYQDSTDEVSLLTGKQCAATVTPVHVNLGWTSSVAGEFALALQEILPLITPPPPPFALTMQAVKRASSY